jgi:hypothetical protein
MWAEDRKGFRGRRVHKIVKGWRCKTDNWHRKGQHSSSHGESQGIGESLMLEGTHGGSGRMGPGVGGEPKHRRAEGLYSPLHNCVNMQSKKKKKLFVPVSRDCPSHLGRLGHHRREDKWIIATWDGMFVIRRSLSHLQRQRTSCQSSTRIGEQQMQIPGQQARIVGVRFSHAHNSSETDSPVLLIVHPHSFVRVGLNVERLGGMSTVRLVVHRSMPTRLDGGRFSGRSGFCQ